MPEIKNKSFFIFLIYTFLYLLFAIFFYLEYSNINVLIMISFIIFIGILFLSLRASRSTKINFGLMTIGLLLSIIGEYMAFYYKIFIILKISVCFFFTARVFLYVYSRQFIKIISFNKPRDYAIFLFAACFGFSYCIYFLIEDCPSDILPFCIILTIIDAILFITSWYIKPEMVKRNYFRIGIGSLIIYDMLLGFNYFGTGYKINIYPILLFAYLYKMYFFKTYYSYLSKQKIQKEHLEISI